MRTTRRPPTTGRLFGLWLAQLAIGAIPLSPWADPLTPVDYANAITGWVFTAVGLIVWRRRPDHRIGPLTVLTGFLWPLWGYQWFDNRVVFSLAAVTWPTVAAALLYLLLAFPEGRITTRWRRALFASTWAILAVNVGFHLVSDPARYRDGFLAGRSLLLVHRNDALADLLSAVVLGSFALLFAVVIVDVAVRWRRSTLPARRVLAPVVWTSAASILVFVVAFWIGDLPTLPQGVRWVVRVASFAGVWSLPVGFLVGLSRQRTRRLRVSDLVVELGELPPADRFAAALQRTLDDPSVRVGTWDGERYVDAFGVEVALPEPTSSLAATLLDRDDQRLGVIVHDAALLDDPQLVASVRAASRLVVENDRLRAEVEQRLEEVQASRARLVRAADEERRRLERDLHDGAQQRLVSVTFALRVLQARLLGDERQDLDAAIAELQEALDELRDLARGLHPAVVVEQGLGAALDALADRSPIPVDVVARPPRAPAGPVEVAAYFVVAEALTNAVRHSRATAITVGASVEGDELVVEIRDDGRGGADMSLGSGLRGLADRVEALGGSLVVRSAHGKGTTVAARFPLSGGAEDGVRPPAHAGAGAAAGSGAAMPR